MHFIRKKTTTIDGEIAKPEARPPPPSMSNTEPVKTCAAALLLLKFTGLAFPNSAGLYDAFIDTTSSPATKRV